MKRFLCLSLCLGLMASACKKKYTQEELDAALDAARAAGVKIGDTVTVIETITGTQTTPRTKKQVLQACLPQINNMLVGVYRPWSWTHFYLRRTTRWAAHAETPAVVIYTGVNTPHVFAANTAFGLGASAADVTRNLNAMANSTVIQDQFVARENNAPGFRVHISARTHNLNVNRAAAGTAPDAPAPDSGLIIYDRESLAIPDQAHEAIRVLGRDASVANQLDDRRAGWYDCVLDTETQSVTLQYTPTALT